MTCSPHQLSTAKNLLLTPFGLDEHQLNKTLGMITGPCVDYADLYFQYTRNESWHLEDGIVKNGAFNIDQGVGVRAISGEKTALAYASQINQQTLDNAAQSVKAIGAHAISTPQAITCSSQSPSPYDAIDPIASLDAISKIAILNKIEKMARARDTRIVQVIAQLASQYEVIYIARHDGYHTADVRPLVRLSLYVIAEQNGSREEGTAGGGGRVDLNYFNDDLIEKYVGLAVDKALLNLEARPAPAGQMTVVLGSGWPGILLHEAIGHGLEGDFNRKGTSAFSGRLGQKVAASGVTVVDNGTLDKRRGSLAIDDEGQPTQHTVLIENGILKGYMQDSMNAKLMKMAPTGNGRRESYACLPMPRMTNTYMLNGKNDPQEIIASVKNGFYAVSFSGGEVDITSGRFVFSASEAWRIENGKLSYPVKGATLIGNGPDVLHHVSMIGNDLAWDGGVGTCGKQGQSVPVGVGQPTLRIDGGLTIGGVSL